jgi:GAF domain-containing protein
MEAGHVQEGAAPTDAAATIAAQQAEIERLQQRIAEDRFAQHLRDALTTASATGTIAAPVGYQRLVNMIVATAADIIDAKAAALFLFDAHHLDLVLEVAFGEKVKPVKDFRVPPGQGVVGLVAMTGQPMAISEADDEVREHAYLSRAVGYPPENLLCVPLSFHDRVIGVLGVMDKKGDATFSAGDIEAIAMFAHLAAVAVEQYRTETRLGALLVELVQAVDGLPDDDRHRLTERARAFTGHLGRQAGYLTALELAELVQEVVQHGDAATKACRGLLSSFVQFLRSRPVPAGELGGM